MDTLIKSHTAAAHLPGSPDAQDWIADLERAVAGNQEQAIWGVMQHQAHKEEAHEALANMVSRMAYEHRGVDVYSEVFMMPIVAEPGCKIMDMDGAWKIAAARIKQSLGEWFPKGTRVNIFNGIQPMDWVTSWTPSVMRNHLLAMRPGQPRDKTEFVTETITLPDEAPTLGFVVIGLSQPRDWPELPEVDSVRDARFKNVIKHSLQLSMPDVHGRMAAPPAILTPERVQYAVTDGISLWLHRLHESIGITGWMIAPSQNSRDVVYITLSLDHEIPYVQFMVRLHQIGMQGLNEIVSVLNQSAPCMEKPVDTQTGTIRGH